MITNCELTICFASFTLKFESRSDSRVFVTAVPPTDNTSAAAID